MGRTPHGCTVTGIRLRVGAPLDKATKVANYQLEECQLRGLYPAMLLWSPPKADNSRGCPDGRTSLDLHSLNLGLRQLASQIVHVSNSGLSTR